MNVVKTAVEISRLLAANADVAAFCMVGSACYMDNPKDVDVLVLSTKDNFLQGARWSFGAEWELCSGEYEQEEASQWGALRKGDVNLIVTVDRGYYERSKLANEVCCALKLADKRDRIRVYRVVRDRMDAASANQQAFASSVE